MSNFNWPSNVVPLTSRNYSFALGSNITQTQVGGMPNSGVDLTIEAVPFSVNFILSDYQYQVVNAFYYGKINRGASSFNMTLDAGVGLEVMQCKIKAGTWRVVKPSHGTWSLSFTAIAESTSSQLDTFCDNLYDLNECYGDSLHSILEGLSTVWEALPDGNV